MQYNRRNRLNLEAYKEGILSGDKVVLGRAITLIESRLKEDQDLASKLLSEITPHTGKSIRIGITGVPGVGKSSFIEVMGLHLTSMEKKLAVLAVDPSSQISKGSIMGDKTRMETLARDPMAFIRPSATGSSLGGVADKTRESLLLCEAAGYEIIFIETVGVGQSETLVHGMVDFFLLLMLAGAGDELQGIKKGIMEMADLIVITKADGENLANAQVAKTAYQNALHLFAPNPNGWTPGVVTCSAMENIGIADIWAIVEKYCRQMRDSGYFNQKRQNQNLAWMHEQISRALETNFHQKESIKKELKLLEEKVLEGKCTATDGARQLLDLYFRT
ncbi:MAG: methylmalonyl Co-A mutase-associated GTPase MeaB [Cyclobacteriaceae bacterium]